MRPLRLDLHGFTVFREPTTLDLTDVDFFALVGPTGAGKSTLLDAICFALYGTVPRWGDRRRIENALAPSVSEARVRLAFEASGVRFVATRVVRRDGKGKVSTFHAGLEQLPAGFDLSTLDLDPAERGGRTLAGESGLGIVLAGTPAEMDAAVLEAVGLPYEQFTSCVVLPQGEFARFLHAKPAERQEILVNLLGLHVYQRIGERAGLVQREAEAKAAATRSLLGDVIDVDDAALAAAEEALTAARCLVGDVDRELPAFTEATEAGAAAQADLARVERELSALAAIRVPAGVSGLGDEAMAARDAAERADAAVLAAEELEEKVRAELAAAGDRATLTRLLDSHKERAQCVLRSVDLQGAVDTAERAHAAAATALAAAQAKAETARAAVITAAAAVEAAQTADRAASLRAHLAAGEPCPVCEQDVTVIPTSPAPALAAARAAHAKAEKAVAAAAVVVDQHDRALREADRSVATATAQHAALAERLAALDAALESAPAPKALEAALRAITKAEKLVDAAAESVRTTRQESRAAGNRLRAADEAVRTAWRTFDATRDGLAALAPPPVDRDDLVGSWSALHAWAQAGQAERARSRDAVLAVAEAALTAITAVVGRLDALFAAAGLPAGAGEPGAYRQAAAVAVERATAARDRVLERRDQAARLTEQVAEYEREALVAKSLALHLRADRFERWLLTEALDALVVGASRILRELSGGQYDLAHTKGEFFVIDHAEAGLQRGVRTLSGGETFQASLALALALSEQLAGLSSSPASLESIMLDEGFGTLDATTLDTVAATLENLAARGDRMVGVVTHVGALAERIPVRFEILKDARGSARIVRAS